MFGYCNPSHALHILFDKIQIVFLLGPLHFDSYSLLQRFFCYIFQFNFLHLSPFLPYSFNAIFLTSLSYFHLFFFLPSFVFKYFYLKLLTLSLFFHDFIFRTSIFLFISTFLFTIATFSSEITLSFFFPIPLFFTPGKYSLRLSPDWRTYELISISLKIIFLLYSPHILKSLSLSLRFVFD